MAIPDLLAQHAPDAGAVVMREHDGWIVENLIAGAGDTPVIVDVHTCRQTFIKGANLLHHHALVGHVHTGHRAYRPHPARAWHVKGARLLEAGRQHVRELIERASANPPRLRIGHMRLFHAPYPIRRHDHIVVERRHDLAAAIGIAGVLRGGEADVDHLDQTNRSAGGHVVTDDLCSAVTAAVDDHDVVGTFDDALKQAAQGAVQQSGTIVRGDQHAEGWPRWLDALASPIL